MIVRVWTTALAPGALQATGVLNGEASVRTIAVHGDIAETLMALSQNREFQ